MLLGLIAVALVIGAYWIVWYLTGEHVPLAWWDEWRLSRCSLAELDQSWGANPRRSETIVTLTTIPERVEGLGLTLKSLLRQSVRPAEIRLCLPAVSRRTGAPYVVPAWLRELRGVTLVSCPDEGPATKFLTTLRQAAPDAVVVVLDDDRVYHHRLIERLTDFARQFPDEVVTAAGWSAPADFIDRPTTLARRWRGAAHVPSRGNQVRQAKTVDIVQGVHGYVVRPRFFDLDALGDFTAAPPELRYVDDVWLSAHCLVPRRVRPLALPFTDYQPWQNARVARRTALGHNVNRALRDEDRPNSIALRFFSNRWLVSTTRRAA
jgi:hypothetical protein